MSSSNNSRAAKLVGKSYFFTEPDKVEQLADQAFGPMGPNPEQQFRLGAKMRVKLPYTSAKAFAICSGNVLVQPQTGNANKVNLILRPVKQPFQGMPVKYFIYRGLDSAGFVTTTTINDQIVSILANTGASPFIQEVREDYESLNGTNESNAIRSSWIGFDLGNPPYTGLIDDLFFRISPPADDLDPVNAKNDELPFVKEGLELGQFSGDFQLDIVLGSPDYKQVVSSTGFYYDMDFARAAEGIIDIANCPSNYPVKAYREAILDFIDPAAFWGMHCTDGGRVSYFNGSNIQSLEGHLIFSQIVMVFTSCSVVYLVITSELRRSYGFYDGSISSPKLFLIRNNNEEYVEVNYMSSSWPLYIEDTSESNSSVKKNSEFFLLCDNKTFIYNSTSLSNSDRNKFTRSYDSEVITHSSRLFLSAPIYFAGQNGSDGSPIYSSLNKLFYREKLIQRRIPEFIKESAGDLEVSVINFLIEPTMKGSGSSFVIQDDSILPSELDKGGVEGLVANQWVISRNMEHIEGDEYNDFYMFKSNPMEQLSISSRMRSRPSETMVGSICSSFNNVDNLLKKLSDQGLYCSTHYLDIFGYERLQTVTVRRVGGPQVLRKCFFLSALLINQLRNLVETSVGRNYFLAMVDDGNLFIAEDRGYKLLRIYLVFEGVDSSISLVPVNEEFLFSLDGFTFFDTSLKMKKRLTLSI